MKPDTSIPTKGINKYLCLPRSKSSAEKSFNILYIWPYEKNRTKNRVKIRAALILFFRIIPKTKNPTIVPPEIANSGRSNSVGIKTCMF